MKKYFKATTPAGYVLLRSSASRTYTYASITRPESKSASWSSRLDLAQRAGIPLPATEISAKEYRYIHAEKKPERDAADAALKAARIEWIERTAEALRKRNEAAKKEDERFRT